MYIFNIIIQIVHVLNIIIYTVQNMNSKQKEDSTTLEILQVIEKNNDLTQRHLADKLDVALGLANLYLKRCVHKGLIKVKQAPANRYLYYLTPKGFAEKSRLTADYLSSSFNFYRDASSSINEVYQQCEASNLNRILLCGISELAEIALVRAYDYQIKITSVFAPKTEKQNFLNIQIITSIDSISGFDSYLVTGLEDAQELYTLLITKVDPKLIFVPSLLDVNRNKY